MTSVARITRPPKKAAIPPLRNGDRLTVAEFRRRYEAMPEVKKAELINGVVYMSSPVSMNYHSEPHCNLSGWMFTYRVSTPGVQAGDNASMRDLIGEHEPQPDLCLRIIEECGGQSRIDSEGYLAGGPECVGEVSASTVKYDLHEKLAVYQENNIREYIVWRVEDEAIDWFILKHAKYQRLAKTKDGLYKSKVFPGLWLDPRAMILGDLTKVIETLQKGLVSPEHQRFVAKLRDKRK